MLCHYNHIVPFHTTLLYPVASVVLILMQNYFIMRTLCELTVAESHLEDTAAVRLKYIYTRTYSWFCGLNTSSNLSFIFFNLSIDDSNEIMKKNENVIKACSLLMLLPWGYFPIAIFQFRSKLTWNQLYLCSQGFQTAFYNLNRVCQHSRNTPVFPF